jgi:hypothetical protein
LYIASGALHAAYDVTREVVNFLATVGSVWFAHPETLEPRSAIPLNMMIVRLMTRPSFVAVK